MDISNKRRWFLILLKLYWNFIENTIFTKSIRLVLDYHGIAKDFVGFWPFMKSQRGAPLIVYNGFVYRCERKISNKTYWLCIRYKGQKCKARLILRGNEIIKQTNHNHKVDNPSSNFDLEMKNLEDCDVDEWIKGTSFKSIKDWNKLHNFLKSFFVKSFEFS